MAATCSLTLALLYAFATPAVGLDWHPNWTTAVEAAAKNGRVAYIFVYLPYRTTCGQMYQRTFSNAEVIKRLDHFDLGDVDASTKDGGDFVRRYNLAFIQDPHSKMKLAVVPAHLFFAPDGTLLLRQYGFIPAQGFAALLDRVDILRHCRAQLKQNSHDASACAQMGHTLIVLNQIDDGRRYAEMAIAYDPSDATGAPIRARLDLAILAIKSDPNVGVDRLRRWLDAYGTSALRLEGRFYLATAYYAAGNTRAAEDTLMPFVNARKGSPEGESDWGALGRGLYKEIHK
jgi:hypothetical protein